MESPKNKTGKCKNKWKKNSDEISEEKTEIMLGKTYVLKRGNKWALGEVIHKRNNKKKGYNEYYVSYVASDRRLDEWVRSYRIGKAWEDAEIPSKRSCAEIGGESESEDPVESELEFEERERRELTKIKLTNLIQFGHYEIETWYYSPYPNGFNDKEKLYICKKCFKYMCLESSYVKHLVECVVYKPPGKVVYRKNLLSIFEVDGHESLLYCQNLSLLAKLFIDHKTLCYDVETFLFYILCSKERDGYIIKGFFSKEKDSVDGYNLSCIMTLPPFQKKGFGKLLIDFSYKLSIIEGSPGSPEEPISDLGLFTYQSYWTWAILNVLHSFKGSLSVSDLCMKTGISEGDVIYTLESLQLLRYFKNSKEIVILPGTIDAIVKSSKFKKPRLTIDNLLISWKCQNGLTT